MQFNSISFFIFAALFFGILSLLPARSTNLRWGLLTFASFVFYGWWDWRYLSLLVISGLIDFMAAAKIESDVRRRKAWLALSIAANLGILGIFKYCDFFLENLNWATGSDFDLFHLVLPVGISFYTFQSMSYTIDVYRGRLRPTPHLLHYFSYLSMFPQLVAGPIVRAKDVLGQLAQPPRVSAETRAEGLHFIVRGFFKKVVMADNLAPVVNQAFAQPDLTLSAPYWWLVMLGFSFQIYFDFSGYSDIAIGLCRWMGLKIPLNFNHPYRSASLREFWTRWHISLSSWFRDYVYVSLGGSRKGVLKGHIFLWITMLLSGVWHGAAWTYLCWGAIHAFFLSVERLTSWPERLSGRVAGRVAVYLLVMIQVVVAWAFFRAESVGQGFEIVSILFNPDYFAFPDEVRLGPAFLLVLFASAGWEVLVWLRSEREWRFQPSVSVKMVSYAAVACLCIVFRGPEVTFIYFQF